MNEEIEFWVAGVPVVPAINILIAECPHCRHTQEVSKTITIPMPVHECEMCHGKFSASSSMKWEGNKVDLASHKKPQSNHLDQLGLFGGLAT
ncbi:hypothetical protein VSS37_18555 [Candidatus Thiothrix sp. Deng01]|uniref:Uncharacterized protein n=1 Tax=Candidatus Thiothrix phosphatis TaxID=3112415 RepID=A0ABU6D2V3_9GAMM|nr:hypothetical protein [Candidatus Thiothrix sp. Deng01]MEB4592988.1 hypothetical protein [Candidatus Thiothrix sp. Deng01]